MQDVLPEEADSLLFIETSAREIMESAAYREMRLPLAESIGLFRRSIGERTDIMEKEIYRLSRYGDAVQEEDGEALVLRPEGTVGCLRAALQHGMVRGGVQRLWYCGEMFRCERPQKGRRRQFRQIGAELLGLPGAEADAELISLGARLWRRLGVEQEVRLEINSLGDAAERARYLERLCAWLEERKDALDADSRRRLGSNPLRILDSKHPQTRELLQEAPGLEDFLGEDTRRHFAELRALLEQMEIPYRVNPRLVRGLDYYCRTVFEWLGEGLGAQSAVAAGGRYDGLVAQLGGTDTPAAGFALGLERLALLPGVRTASPAWCPDACLVLAQGALAEEALVLAERLRAQAPGARLWGPLSGSLSAQLKKAVKSGSPLALIYGAEEKDAGALSVRALHEQQGEGEQRSEKIEAVAALLRQLSRKNRPPSGVET